MRRFNLYQELLALRRVREAATDETQRERLQASIRAAERELAMLDASIDGASLAGGVSAPDRQRGNLTADRQFWQHFETSDRPYLLVDPGPGLIIVDVNDAYARVTMIDRSAVAGQRLFDVFPDNSDDSEADGVNNLFQSLRTAAITLRPDTMDIQRYDIRDQDGQFVERYWQPVNTPLFDESGHLKYLLHWVEDVTEQVLARREPP
jgi:PAS domain-containing protein